MDRDLRLYYFSGSILHKVPGKKYHKCKSMTEIRTALKNLWYWKEYYRNKQMVVVEYTAPYQSEIVGLYKYPFNNDEGEQ